MTACELCDADPAEGGSSMTDDAGTAHHLCHPVTGSDGPRLLSCFETVAYVIVEAWPNGRRPPEPIPEAVRLRARAITASMSFARVRHPEGESDS